MLTLVITVAVVAVSSVYLILRFIRGNRDYWTKRGVATSKTNITFNDRLKKPFHELDHIMYNSVKSQGVSNYFGFVELRKPLLFAMDPELIKAILVKDFNIFTNRRSLGLGSNEKFFHNMIFFMEDQPWKDMRSTISPTFSTGKIKAMNELLNECGDKLVNYLSQRIEDENRGNTDGLEIDVQDVIGRYTLDVIASVAFGLDSENFSKPNSVFYQMSQRINMAATMSFSLILKFITLTLAPKLFGWLNLSVFDKTAVEFFANVVEKSIAQRETDSAQRRNDFLQLMIEAKHGLLLDDTGATVNQQGRGMTLNNDRILANCVLFFIAGFDTSESLLTFTVYELALNPEVQDRLYEEVNETMDKTGSLTYDIVASMSYLDMVISEALRKYPPAFRLERRADADYSIPNSSITLEKGSLAIIPVYCIHHDADFYPEPERFIPERFTAEAKLQRHPYIYLPFGQGPRSCVAMRFALLEAKSAIAHLVHKFRFEPCEKTSIPVTFKKSASALKPGQKLYLKLNPRH